jgi:hypothetical protein
LCPRKTERYMSLGFAEVDVKQVRRLVTKLIDFLGPIEVRRRLDRYQRRLRDADPVLYEYVKGEHPWWEALTQYDDRDKAAKSVHRNLTPEIRALMMDAKKIVDLLPSMPNSVKKKYRTNLVGDRTARGYLFEIHVAWHFSHMGHPILWYEPGNDKQAEFLVKASDYEFNVECKRISVDKSRKVRRQDFRKLAQKLVNELRARHYLGRITITLDQRLPSDDIHLNGLVQEIVSLLNAGRLRESCQIPCGNLSLDLASENGIVVDLGALYDDLTIRKGADAHGLLSASCMDDRPTDPIELVVASKKSDGVLNGIADEIYNAGKGQLDSSMPGFIACFLEEIDDLRELSAGSELQRMTCSVLARSELSHVAAIAYHGERLIRETLGCQMPASQMLIFRNPQCRFENAKGFKFFSTVCDT